MKELSLRTCIPCCLVALALAACGGKAKPAEDASSKKDDAAATEGSDKSADASDKKADQAEKAEKKEEKKAEDTGMPPVVRTPKSYLTAPDIVFKFNFKESDVGTKAEKDCADKTKGDGAKMAKCMTAAQKKQVVDDYHFKQDDNGNWFLLAMQTKGSAISWTHRLPIEFGKETDKTIVVKITGADKGQKPWRNPPSEITFEVPNEYQLVQRDDDLGKLVFDSKISTLGDGSNKKPGR